ncbi:MAG: TrbI/VirB10 family protein, partial [Acidobacteriia bacterium]|nr:TrbI/VirB10 family protein [Terriglobia bacterium]
MNHDDPVRVDRPHELGDPAATTRVGKQDESAAVSEQRDAGAASEPSPEPFGWAAQMRQAMQRSAQGQARTNIKRDQLKEDRTKAFLLLAGSTVVLGLMFFALFSSPSSSHRSNSTRPNEPNLGRGPAGEKTDTSRSVTPLLKADTRNTDDDAGAVSAQDIRNTAKQRMIAQAGSPPSAPPPVPSGQNDYALNKIQFPTGQAPPPPTAPPAEKLNKASLVFVSAGSGTGARPAIPSGASTPAYLAVQSDLLPPGTRMVARLETPVSTAVKAPVVAAIEYNYDRDGETVIPAGSRAFGELDQANDRGYVGIRFQSLQLADGSTEPIDGRSMGLDYKPLEGKVTGKNTGKKFLVRSLTGVGTILAATVGVQGGLGINDTISDNVLLRERLADNVALAGEQQLNDLAYRQNIVVTVAGNTRFYIVLAKSGERGSGSAAPGGAVPGGNATAPTSVAASSVPSVQELRELM